MQSKRGRRSGNCFISFPGAQQFLISPLNPSGRWKGFSFYYKHKINCLLNEALINLNLAHLSLIFKLVCWIVTIPFWTGKWNAGIEPRKYFPLLEKGCEKLGWGGQSRQSSNSSVAGVALISSGSTLEGNSPLKVLLYEPIRGKIVYRQNTTHRQSNK